MVQISSALVAFLLVAPSLAVPLSREQDFQAREVAISARDVVYLEDLAARDPSIGSFFKKIKNFFSPSHIDKAANTAKEASKLASMLKREDAVEEFTARDFEALEELAARDPHFRFGSVFKKIKHLANFKNLKAVAGVAALAIREEDEMQLTVRDMEELEELAARNPSFGSFFRKVKHFANFNNIKKVANVASMVVREDDDSEFTARDLEELEELAARDPSFGSFFRKVKHFANFNNIKKVANVASMVVREDDGLFERDYSDLELDQLD
jgi:hypothetical protein